MIAPPLRRAVAFGALAALLLAAGGCGSRSSGQQASAAQKAACRQRADQVYASQNRADLYNSDRYQTTTRDAPFATSGLPGITSRGLGGQYARETLISDCLNDVAGNVGNSANDPPPPTGERATPGSLPRSLSPLAVPPGN